MSDLTPRAAILTAVFSHAPAPPAQPATPPAAPATPTAPAIPFEPYPHANLSPSHAAQMIEWEKENLANGTITPEEATRRFDALGATLEQRAPDTRTDEVKLIDQHFPPAKESDFLIQYGDPRQPAPPMTKALTQFDHSARVWLAEAEFDRKVGNSLITQIERTVQATKGMTPEQLESYGLVEFEKLKKSMGARTHYRRSCARRR